MSKRSILPGERIVTIISALEGGTAEQIIRCIAQRCAESVGHTAADWQDYQYEGALRGKCDSDIIRVTLKLGVQEGLFLRNHPLVCGCSMKPVQCSFSGDIFCGTINVGQIMPHRLRRGDWQESDEKRWQKCYDGRCRRIANLIVGTYLTHGFQWTNRPGEDIYWPFGKVRNKNSRIWNGPLPSVKR